MIEVCMSMSLIEFEEVTLVMACLVLERWLKSLFMGTKFWHPGKMQRMRRLWQCFSCKSNSSLSLIFDAWQPYSRKLHSSGKSLIIFSHNKFLFEVEKFKGARHIGQVAILGIRHLLHKICPLLHWCTIDLGLGIEQHTGHSRRV